VVTRFAHLAVSQFYTCHPHLSELSCKDSAFGERLLALPAPCLALFVIWQLHYLHRTLVHPFQLRAGSGRISLLECLGTALFNAFNGYMQSAFILDPARAPHMFGENALFYLLDARFLVGVALFCLGFLLSMHSDHILQQLHSPSSTAVQPMSSGGPELASGRFRIPLGGAFAFVSCPHHLGQLIEWTGFALASWTPAGAAFALLTAAIVVPRALAKHAWYRGTFPNYPPERTALIPRVL
jgi:3-oxo-5-alpha-steroid 4-dehydrogenase 1